MSLLDAVKQEAPATEGASKAKKSNSEYQKKAREARLAAADKVKAWADKQPNVPAEVKDALALLTRRGAAGGSTFGKPVIYQVFGDAPKAGSKVTALEVFQKTGKGFPEMKKAIKKWAEGNVVVKYDEKAMAYVLESGDVPAYTA